MELKDLLKIKMASGNTASLMLPMALDDETVKQVYSLVAGAFNLDVAPTEIFAAIHQDDDAHDTCTLTACLNPLHPGPCKGWKHSLHQTSPAAWHALEAARVEKANKTRVAKIEALKAQGKPIPKKLLVPIVAKKHPDEGKTAKAATGEAHAAGQAVSDAAGVHVNTPGKVTLGQAVKTVGPVEKGPKGKKPTLASKGIAFIIAQEKVTPQYKLDKAATITPEQWNALSHDDKATIRGELVKIKKDGFGPQQKKASELLGKLPAEGKVVDKAQAVNAQHHADAAAEAMKKPINLDALKQPTATPKPGATAGPKLADSVKQAAKEAHPAKIENKPEKPKDLPKHVQHAIDMANGHAPGASWSKNHLAAYQPLTTEEFHSLPPETQTKIVTELKKGQTKFLDPKKQQAAKDLLAKFGKGPATPTVEKAPTPKAADKHISFSQHFHDHNVTQEQAKEAVAKVHPTALYAALKHSVGLADTENPDHPDLLMHAEDGAWSLIKHGLASYSPDVLKQPAVKDAINKATRATTEELHARLVGDAKKKAFNKVNQKLAIDGSKLPPVEKAALRKYREHLLSHPIDTSEGHIDDLKAQTTKARAELNAALHKAQADVNAPKPSEMTGAQLDSKVKELLGDNFIDPTKPKTSASLAEMQYAKTMATAAVGTDSEQYPASVLADPTVAAKQSAYINAVASLNATKIGQQHLNDHIKHLHEDTALSGTGVGGKPLSKEDKQILALHAVKLGKDNPHVSPAAVADAQAKADQAKAEFHAAAEKVAAGPAEPVKLTDFDKATVADAFSSAWSKHASKATTFGVNYATAQKMKAHPEYAQFTQDLGNLKDLAGKAALARAEEHTASLNVPTDPDTGALEPGPEHTAWMAAMSKRKGLESQFNTLRTQAQKRLDAIRTSAGLKKRALPKLDAPAVKAAAAEHGYYKSGGYGGPNHLKPTAAKNYMVAKVGPGLGVTHLTPTEKKAAKLGSTLSAPAPKVTPAAPGVPVKVGDNASIAGLPADLKKQITSDFKAMPDGKYLTDPAEDIFNNLVSLAAAHGKGVDGGLSVDQVLKTIDETHAKNLGVANSGMLEKKIMDWLATSAGKSYAQAHSTPDAKKVKQLTGELDLPPGVTLAPGQKVQKVAGPGPHDESLPHEAFKKASSVSAQVAQDQYMKDQGVKWSKDQKSALKGYTGSLYSQYNNYLRHGGTLAPNFKQDIILMQSAMMPLQQHTLLRRGTGWDALPAEYHGFDNAQKLIGKTIEEPGFTSTTVAGESGHFGGPLQLEIEAPVGTAAAFVNGISHYKNQENEMLLAAGTKFKVLSVEQKGHQTVMRVRVVGDK